MPGIPRVLLLGATLLAVLTLLAGPAAAQEANLVVEDVGVSPSDPESGDATNFPVTVANTGDEPSEPFVVRWILEGGDRLDDREVAALDPGESVTVRSRNWSATQGDHSLRAVADATDRTPESDETDNVLRIEFNVSEAQTPKGLVDVLDTRLPEPRDGLGAALLDGVVYLAGGVNDGTGNGTGTREILAFDPDEGTVEGTNVSLQQPLEDPAVVATPTRVHVLGGERSGTLADEVRTLDPGNGTLERRNVSLPSEWCCGDAFWNGTHVILVGGRTPDGPTGAIVAWRPGGNGTRTLAAALPEPRTDHRVAWDARDLPNAGCPDGCAYVVGGANATGAPFRSIHRYNPSRGAVERVSGELPRNGSVDGAAVWSGRHVHVVGGEDPPEHLRRIVRYDPVIDDENVRPARLPTGRHGSAAAWVDGEAYILGGRGETVLDEVVRYRPGRPDLALGDLRVRPSEPTVGEDVRFPVRVTNLGEVRADNYTVRFRLDNRTLSTASLGGLDVNRSLGVRSEAWTAPSGPHTVSASVVLKGTGEELTLDNNQVRRTFAVNEPPTPALRATVDGLNVTVNASNSNDPDGQLSSFRWSWGDGTSGTTGPDATHRYGASGNHTITLVVTDGSGANATTTRSVTVNRPPLPAFSTTIRGETVDVDGTASKDPDDDPLVSYLWSWGDNTTLGEGAKTNHTYAEIGIYEITLNVRDSLGADATFTKEVEVWGPIPGPGLLPALLAAVGAAWAVRRRGLP
jgi:PKD repeat protein